MQEIQLVGKKDVLNLENTNVTDDDLKVLCANFQNIKEINIRGTLVTECGLKWLAFKFPNCNVLY
jgi:hypothetical protein